METKKVRRLLSKIKKGDVISAKWLNEITDAVNDNTRAPMSPQNKRPTPGRDTKTGDSTYIYNGGSYTDEEFKAYADDITSVTETITDDNGDDHDVEVITEVVFIETTTGRSVTWVLDYDNNRPT